MDTFAKAIAFSDVPYDESKPMAEWLQKFYPYAQDLILECVQEPGEVIFVPSRYLHAVINTKDSIGIAAQV